MKTVSQSCIFTTLLIFLLINSALQTKKKGPQCATCKEIVKNFKMGLDRTKKSNYGGGNTDWEESRLGQYANSEVRLVEIMDNLCEGASKECPQMLEAYEELVEEFWFNSGLEKEENEFHQFFCIEKVQACCPKNTFGPSCNECTGGLERPCKNNGVCNGEGTREGTGKCKCNLGFKGKLCDECSDGYYEVEKNDTHTVCKVCHISCKKSCTGEGPNHCDECKEGWSHDEETGCKDINECSDNPCSEKQYCTNTQGSYLCLSCNAACDSCSGPGKDKCSECSDGYLRNGSECLDIDECESEEHEGICSLDGQKCVNTAGSYTCACKEGYVKEGDGCKIKPKDKSKRKEKKGKDQMHLSPREADLMIVVTAFMGLSIIFFVISKICYVISPYLLSVPVVVFSSFVYYFISRY